MSEAPYAYQRWVCSTCDGEPISEQNGDADLRCEHCGHLFQTGAGGYAQFVPDPDDEIDEAVAEEYESYYSGEGSS